MVTQDDTSCLNNVERVHPLDFNMLPAYCQWQGQSVTLCPCVSVCLCLCRGPPCSGSGVWVFSRVLPEAEEAAESRSALQTGSDCADSLPGNNAHFLSLSTTNPHLWVWLTCSSTSQRHENVVGLKPITLRVHPADTSGPLADRGGSEITLKLGYCYQIF